MATTDEATSSAAIRVRRTMAMTPLERTLSPPWRLMRCSLNGVVGESCRDLGGLRATGYGLRGDTPGRATVDGSELAPIAGGDRRAAGVQGFDCHGTRVRGE